MAAAAIVLLVHICVATWVLPNPMPRRDLRRKVLPLTRDTKPSLIVFGDSRAECGFIPDTLAASAGIEPSVVVNIATPACEPAGGAAAYRAFADRFAARPVMLLSVSLFAVNDHAHEELIGQESLWGLSLADRLSVAPARRAIEATFLPERELLHRYVLEPLLLSVDTSQFEATRGYRGKDRTPAMTMDAVRAKLIGLERRWFNDAKIDGVRWRLFEQNVGELREAGVQLVIVDPPEHPLYLEALADSDLGSVNARFHEKLRTFCENERIPLLRYGASDICADDPASIFVSVLHLNRKGAQLMSQRAGDDLRAMVESGCLQWPEG